MDDIVNLCNNLEVECQGLAKEADTKGRKGVMRDPKVAKPKGVLRLAKQRLLGKRRRCEGAGHSGTENHGGKHEIFTWKLAKSINGKHVGNDAKVGCTINEEWANEVRIFLRRLHKGSQKARRDTADSQMLPHVTVYGSILTIIATMSYHELIEYA
ncbi:hypothetical protein AHAS_Ahas11G0095200 [Arachis hypogaea]